MPPGAKVDRHTLPEDDELIDVLSDDDREHDNESEHHHEHSDDEETDSDEEHDEYSEDDRDHHHHHHRPRHVHEDELEVTTGSSFSDLFEEDEPYIVPSDSASRSRHPTVLPRSSSQRRYPASTRPPGRRAQTSRDYAAVPEPPTAPLSRRGSKRPTRTRSVTSGTMFEDEFSDIGRYYPHPSGPSREYDTYSSSRSGFSAHDEPYYPHDPNVFTAPHDPYQSRQRGNRASMPPRAMSGGHEVMALGHYGSQYNGYPVPHGYPPYGHPGYGYPHYPPHHPNRDRDRDRDRERERDRDRDRDQDRIVEEEKKKSADRLAEATAKLKAEEDKLAQLQKFIQKQHEDQMKREQKAEEARQAEAQAKAAAEYKSLEDKLRADEKKEAIKLAAEKAKADAEKAAAKKAEEEKAKYDKEMAEIKKKHADLEEAKKKIEAEAKALRPDDDKLKAPIKFKDAVGRKFSFPWHVCKTWKGMESLILQAFSHIDNLGQMVADGHYDLIGPDSEIILPQIWETVVKPDMSIHMQMWPLPEKKKAPMHPQHAALFGSDLAAMLGGTQMKPKKSSKTKDKKVKVPMAPGTHFQLPPGMMIPPPPVGALIDGAFVPPPPPPDGFVAHGITEVKKSKSKDGSKKKGSSSKGILGWMTGAPPKKDAAKKKK